MRIGLFSAAHPHIYSYVTSLRAAGAEVIGIADDHTDRGRSLAAAYGIPWFDSYETMLIADPDGVVVCSETIHHRPLIELAADARVAVLCEKPLATTEADSRAIVDMCAEMGVPLMTAFSMRFSPPVREVYALLASGALGEVYAATCTNQAKLPTNHYSWATDPELSGGGALMDHVVHVVDLLRWYLRSEVVEVYATTNRLLHENMTAVETAGLILITFEGGVFASLDCSWSRPETYPMFGGLNLDIVAEWGVVSIDAFSQRLTVYSDPAGLSWVAYGSDPYQGLIDEFLSAIRERRKPIVTGEDGHAATVVALAAAESAETGRPIPLPAGSEDRRR